MGLSKIKLSDFPTRVLKRDMEVDGIHTGMLSFIHENCIAKDVDHISREALQAVVDLKKGESCYVGHFVLVTRLS